ncbi:siroheme synthase CysG [Acidipila sp. EB88]|uniref:siroheme synthase CysG n=1 Tax=Acidipila sp. EB88 TaxID=2305226 RepID=UPI000F5ED6CB|nr:siroheme synthase CysG [Acidipila sp. EB88]
MSLLPVFLKLNGRAALVVGAGEVASGKIESLVASDAQVTVVAPWAKPEIERLAERGAITWHRREFQDTDLDGQFIVIAGTNFQPINQHVYRLCAERGILCNAVDDIPHCDFYYGSVVARGDLQIAISTNGDSPSLAQRLRHEIDAQLPRDLGPWLHAIGRIRQDVLAAYPSGEPRKLLLQQLAHRSACHSETCPSRELVLPPVPPATATRPTAATTAPSAPTEQVSVWLVGAGPGDPDLLTVKAARLLAGADLLLHDDLVPDAVLALAPATAEIVNVGKRCGRASITQAQIHELMLAGARSGRRVIRLKSGDPLLFGRAGEEMDALRAANIPFAVVPGVTAASAAAAALPCSLTDRRAASSILLATGHTAPDEPRNPEPTRVVYMPGRDLTAIARQWSAEGLPADYPCVLVSHAGRPDQQSTRTTLGLLHHTAPGPAPVLLMGGAVFAEQAENKTPYAGSGHFVAGSPETGKPSISPE